MNLSLNNTVTNLMTFQDCQSWAENQVKDFVFNQKTDFFIYGLFTGLLFMVLFGAVSYWYYSRKDRPVNPKGEQQEGNNDGNV